MDHPFRPRPSVGRHSSLERRSTATFEAQNNELSTHFSLYVFSKQAHYPKLFPSYEIPPLIASHEGLWVHPY